VSPVADSGLQTERTALAWHRTGLAVLANALVILRSGVSSGHAMLTLLGGLLLVAAAGVAAFGTWRSRVLARGQVDVATPARVVLATSGVTALAAAAGVLAVIQG
jgi:uncharacterized membrane protein YidH (DUF202 family)